MRRRGTAAVIACVAACAAPAHALALGDCTVKPPTPHDLLTGQGTLESTIVDRRGHLYFTSSANGGSLLKVRKPGAQPKPLVTGVASPGGLVFYRGDILMGYGNSIAGGTTGPLDPQAGLLRIDRRAGEQHLYVDGLAMANGVARMRDGTIFASDDGSIGVDRISPDRTVENAWTSVISSNGMAVDRKGKWLYVNQTFVPANIQRVRTNDPDTVEDFFTPPPEDIAAGLDGMTRDRKNNLFVTANAAGELWRVEPDRDACVIASGLGLVSAVAHGRSRHNFSRGNLYAVDFDGRLIELPGALKTRP